jgi:hypothetical protein
LSSSDQPGHGNFILGISYYSDGWRSPQNNSLWQGVNGVNNPCPGNYRLPTEAELDTEETSWNSNNAFGAFSSPLKWTRAGYRYFGSGSLDYVGATGRYWSSSLYSTFSRFLTFNSTAPNGMIDANRADGDSVRCIKD